VTDLARLPDVTMVAVPEQASAGPVGA
jgi:hypothetical protein